MSGCARRYALNRSWDQVFEDVYAAYGALPEDTSGIASLGLSRTHGLKYRAQGWCSGGAAEEPLRNH